MSLLERLRRWRKPTEDDHPLSDEEREARERPEVFDEAAKLGGYQGLGPPIPPMDPNDD